MHGPVINQVSAHETTTNRFREYYKRRTGLERSKIARCRYLSPLEPAELVCEREFDAA